MVAQPKINAKMILVNTTFCVDSNIATPFIDFIREVYLPLADSSGMRSALLSELRTPVEQNNDAGQQTRTFALQMQIPSQKALEDFNADVLPEIYRLMASQWGLGVAMFESTLDIIHDHSKK